MADYAPLPVVNSGSSDTSKPAESAGGIAGLPAKPVFGGGPTFGEDKKKDVSPSSSTSGGILNGTTATTGEKKDDADFAKPVTPVSEANEGFGGDNNTSSSADSKPAAEPLPLIDEAPAEKPGPSEPTAASIPTATAPPVTLVTPTAPATSSSDAPAPSVDASLPPKPAEPSSAAEPASSSSAVLGEKRKADEVDDKPASQPGASLFGGPSSASSSLPAKPLAATVESVDDESESAAKKLKTDTGASPAPAPAPAAASEPAPAAAEPEAPKTDALLKDAPEGTPAKPPVEVPAPEPVTVAAPTAEPIAAPVGAPASVAPALEVNLGPAPSAEEIASTSTTAPEPVAGVKKSNSRAKREKKPLPPVGKTARKTRSQGPA